MHRIILAGLLGLGLLAPASAAEPERPAPQPPRTGKERLSDKASDAQRVDDCRVPPARRTRPRPATCPWEVGS